MTRSRPDAGDTFRAWTYVWLSDEFASWDIRPLVGNVACPVLVVQGEDDEYGTREQVDAIAAIVQRSEVLILGECGHAPHRDRPEATLAAMRDFIARVARAGAA